jgi:hypothetical protein
MPGITINHSPFDYIQIQNTIAKYCIALDTKDWALLNQVFTTDVDAKYPFGPALKGVEAVKAKIADR